MTFPPNPNDGDQFTTDLGSLYQYYAGRTAWLLVAQDVKGNPGVTGMQGITGIQGLGNPSFPGMIEAPSNKTYTIDLSAAVSYTVNTFVVQLSGGTCTVDVKINGVTITGLSTLAVTVTKQTFTATAGNVLSIGDTLTMVVSSVSLATDLSFTIKYTT